jgi:hypothetical protein
VSLRRLDFVQLLVENGAETSSVPLSNVLLSWEPKFIRFFLNHDADPVTGSPFAVAFGAKVRTALRPFLEYRKAHPQLATPLQEQIDCALRYFCSKGDLKWISLLTWAGADARSLGPSLEKEYTNDPECCMSGLEEACYSGSIDALKKLKPEPGRDDLTKLLHCAAVSGNKEAIGYLLTVGANPNDKANGGSSALDCCLWHLNFGSFGLYRSGQKSKYAVSKALDCTQELASHGGIWNPNDQSAMNSLRRSLYECEPAVTIELLQLFVKHSACPTERLKELLRTPRMKEHLASQAWHLSRIGLKPEDKRNLKKQPPPAELLARYNRVELYEKVWSQPTRNVAKQLGVSDVWLGKICRALRVPLPGRGHWAKRSAGRPTRKRPPLPSLENLK